MTEHPSPPQVERFLANPADTTYAQHLAYCESCHDVLVNNLVRRNKKTFSFALESSPDSHLEYEQLVTFTGVQPAGEEFEILNSHLKTCPGCREDFFDLLQFRKELRDELKIAYGPRADLVETTKKRRLAWKPAYSLAALILISLVIFAAMFFWKHRRPDHSAQQNSGPLASPKQGEPIAPSSLGQSTETQPKLIAELHDASGRIAINDKGQITGLDDLSPDTRLVIAEILQTQRMPAPPILKVLSTDNSGLRGPGAETFRLLSPVNQVIADAQPVFRWERLSGATRYMVYALNGAGKEIAKSNDLQANQTQWKPSAPLKRGELYSWAVIAFLDGKEVVSPGPSSSEIRFQIISSTAFRDLKQLKKSRSQLALGIFYGRVGMLDEAEGELRNLLKLNPESSLVKNLYQSCHDTKQRFHNRKL